MCFLWPPPTSWCSQLCLYSSSSSSRTPGRSGVKQSKKMTETCTLTIWEQLWPGLARVTLPRPLRLAREPGGAQREVAQAGKARKGGRKRHRSRGDEGRRRAHGDRVKETRVAALGRHALFVRGRGDLRLHGRHAVSLALPEGLRRRARRTRRLARAFAAHVGPLF
jgi:hypothetical protein